MEYKILTPKIVSNTYIQISPNCLKKNTEILNVIQFICTQCLPIVGKHAFITQYLSDFSRR